MTLRRSVTIAAAGSLIGAALAAQAPSRPLSLEEAIRLATPASEAVGIARAGVDRARGPQAQARSEQFPQLTGSASYTKLERGNIFAEFEPWFAEVRPYLERFGNPSGLVDQLNSLGRVPIELVQIRT